MRVVITSGTGTIGVAIVPTLETDSGVEATVAKWKREGRRPNPPGALAGQS
jgi:hypothetical protein